MNADYGKPLGDALRTTSIEAASRAILDAPERPAWHHRGAESREERAERLATAAVDAVLGRLRGLRDTQAQIQTKGANDV